MAWVCSENTSEKLVHQSGTGVSEGMLCWAIWVEMVILLMDSFSFHNLHFLRCLLILVSASMPSQCMRYHWGTEVVSVARGFSGNVIVFLFQSMAGFHFFSQGIPRMICRRPRLRTMSLSFSILSLNRISVWAFYRMVPLVLVVPLMLLVIMGLGSFSRGNLRRQRRQTSIKFPVAPQSTRAVVSTICVPLDSLMGIRMVLSLGRAVITWFMIWEEYINGSSRAKNPQVLQMLCSPGGLHSIVSEFGGLWLRPSHVSLRFERMLQWQRPGEWDWCWAEAWGEWVWKCLWCKCSEDGEWMGCIDWHCVQAFDI